MSRSIVFYYLGVKPLLFALLCKRKELFSQDLFLVFVLIDAPFSKPYYKSSILLIVDPLLPYSS